MSISYRLLLDWVCGSLQREVANLRDDLCAASAVPSPGPSASLKCIRCDALYLRTAIAPEPNPPSGGSHQAPEWFCPLCCAPAPTTVATATSTGGGAPAIDASFAATSTNIADIAPLGSQQQGSLDHHSSSSKRSSSSKSSSSQTTPGRWGDALGAPEGFAQRGLPLLPDSSDERLASDAIAILARPLHGVKQQQQHQEEKLGADQSQEGESERREEQGNGGATVTEWLTVLSALAAAAGSSAKCREHTADIEQVRITKI